MSSIVYLNSSRKYRQSLYLILLLLTAFVIGVYFRDSYLCLIGISIIIFSLIYELKSQLQLAKIEALIFPQDDEKYFKLHIDSAESDFWVIKKNIVINSWVYIYFKQEATNNKIKLWLHKTNFQRQDDIRKLAKFIRLHN